MGDLTDIETVVVPVVVKMAEKCVQHAVAARDPVGYLQVCVCGGGCMCVCVCVCLCVCVCVCAYASPAGHALLCCTTK